MIFIFLSAFAIAFSGAMMPGPLLTYTIKQSLNKGPHSGFLIIAGHAVLEICLIILIFMGFDIILQSSTAQIIIGIVGGLLLVYLGYDMVRQSLRNNIKIELDNELSNSKNMLINGFLISAANPYFLLWWAIIGLSLLLQAFNTYGIIGVSLFFLGHISADIIWYGLISIIVGKTRRFIKDDLYHKIIIALGALLIFFGGSFIINAIL